MYGSNDVETDKFQFKLYAPIDEGSTGMQKNYLFMTSFFNNSIQLALPCGIIASDNNFGTITMAVITLFSADRGKNHPPRRKILLRKSFLPDNNKVL